ncbi:MAG: hypothetical protein KAS04_02785 [Candidatus Aenigmarchaeota archaeon]|nr:hypothetical protein [Candidatus Aenigmarchaeota archaeon]
MISALCNICGKATKQPHSCTFCGAIVCHDHYNVEMGMCLNCAQRLRHIKKV